MRWQLARTYAQIYGLIKDVTDLNLRGLGRALHFIAQPRTFQLAGQRMHFDPRVAGCYGRLIAGQFNERETWSLLQQALRAASAAVTFVEVGANVGEFLIPMGAQPAVQRAVGFEPQPLCAEVCRRSAQLNQLTRVEVREALVGDGASHAFHMDEHNPNASGIAAAGAQHQTVRLDDELPDVHAPAILLIDVEGAEPLVLRGAAQFITRVQPLIIFEYNEVSRQHFSVRDVQSIIGSSYEIKRLRRDGRLDDDVDHSWNCVAIPRGSLFEQLRSLTVAAPPAP